MPNERTIKSIIKFACGLDGDLDLEAISDGLQMMTLHRKVEQAAEDDLARWGVTHRQFELLEILYFTADGAATPASLSDEVGLTRSAMTSALDSLEGLGYIARGPHPRDRRKVTISLVAAGREFIRQRLPERYRSVSRAVGALAPEERRIVIRSYAMILEAIRENLAQ